ncbi:hypothetical protein KSF73_11170 [Burkholderiaceae bacterium DAT-1]|nr:hypothetical protein [Burkholderiaceae bacterium DAT-1]
MAVRVVVPALRFAPHFDPTEGLSLPGLTLWMGRGSRRESTGMHPEEWLLNEFSASGVAELTARQANLPTEDGRVWLKADPIHARVDRDRALVLDVSSAGIDQQEADALVASLNQHFSQDGMEFYAPSPASWFVALNAPPAMSTVPLYRALGQDMQAHLPSGPDGLKWHGILNEIQMLLYTHPVNDQRAAMGRPLLNSLWIWGEGRGEAAQSPAEMIAGNSILIQALSAAAASTCQTVPEALQRLSDDMLLYCDTLATAARSGDIYAWRDALVLLDRDVLVPLYSAWKQGQVPALTLILPDMAGVLTFELTASARWKFWRGPAATSLLAAGS